MKKFILLVSTLCLVMIGCSDSGDAPTGGGGTISPSLSVNDVSGTEGSTITFTISLNVVASDDVIFDYATSNNTATAADYNSVTGTDTITAGNLSTSIQVSIIDDSIVDKNETFGLTISNVLNADITDGSGTGSIIDNDISFSLDVRPLIQGNSCLNAGCHGTGSSAGGFSFGTASYASVRNASGTNGVLIVSGNASSSNFYLKLTATPPFGSRMPIGGSALSTTDLDKIKDWINQGAMDN